MKGLEIAELFYQECGEPMIKEKFPLYKDRIAIGLVGEGSECLGFDDEISKDHDWGPSFCLWLKEEDYKNIGSMLAQEYGKLMNASFMDYPARQESEMSAGRVGVHEIKSFYRRYTGLERVPQSIAEWRQLREDWLSIVTNGKVFWDPLGEFTSFREVLLTYYPEDVRLKKIAARCAVAAQAGQYNFPRALSRGEDVAALLALAEFVNSVLSLTYLLNKKYKPYAKWAHHGLSALPLLGAELGCLLLELTKTPVSTTTQKSAIIETICQKIVSELFRQELTEHKDSFLLSHSADIQRKIKDPIYKKLHIMVE